VGEIGGFMGGRTVFNTKNIKTGDQYPTKRCGVVEVIEYRGSANILIKFLDTGNTQAVRQESLLKGTCIDKKDQRIFGVGVNDYRGQVSDSKNGKNKTYKKFYLCWKSMLQRCYDLKELEKHPTYEKNFVCEEWRSLSKFKEWFDDNYVEGYQLDKDILNPFENEYCPDNCWFIPQDLNKSMAIKTKYGKLTGVHKQNTGKFCIAVGAGKREKVTYKGGFLTEMSAFEEYCKLKKNYLLKTLVKYEDSLPKDKYERCYDFWSSCDMEETIKRWVK